MSVLSPRQALSESAEPRRASRSQWRRPVVWWTGGGLAVAAIAAGAAVGARDGGSAGPHLVTPPIVDGMSLRTTGKAVQLAVAADVKSAFTNSKQEGIVSAVYARTSTATEGVIVVGSNAGLFTDPTAEVKRYAEAQYTLAKQNGYPVPAPGAFIPASPGSSGGRVSCGLMVTATEGIPFAVCAWGDSATNGFAFSNDEKPAQLGRTLAAMRPSLES